ncbi:hypothetical protein GCM10017083_14430 [Thalassobaculum fulvum]|uniref:Blue (type 1) copper domain-containing protein n=1 Tax=Thalassobaculum fulvum TaxID=1633335 RepID=A0A919CQ00_9PROT|nr:cupredoxin family protein [Thalassobaculum fulvum]GHD45874.1 hypothetical protein GCM10017083_14430 [Thalassobaculum fulvum]
MKLRALLSLVLAGGTIAGASAALAGGMHSGGHGHASLDFGKPAKAADAGRTVTVVMRDNLFEPENIAVKAGETVRFVLRNEGAFVHEFNIGTAAMHAAHQKEMMMMVEHGALEPDRINRERMKMDMGGGMTMEHDDPNSVLLEPGESAEIVWTFTTAAELEFACNVPGHYDAGMVGTLSVRPKNGDKTS